jgi:hypothetical protein
MKNRTVRGWLLAGLLAAGCGGGMRPVTFAPDNVELAKMAAGAVAKKDLATVKRCQTTAESRHGAGKMPNDEREAFKWVAETCEKGEWDKAKDFLDKSIASGK